jgi:hypothetical protein
MKQEEVAIATQWHGKHVSTAMNQLAETEELLEVWFSVWSTLRLHGENQQQKLVSRRSELEIES